MSQNKSSYISTLKSTLLSPVNSAREVDMFGGKVFIRRLTASESIAYDCRLDELLNAESLNSRAISEVSLRMLLSAFVDPDGRPIPEEVLPTVDEMLDRHDTHTLNEAIKIARKHAIGTLDAAEKN